jgi:3-isopropylmalate dehydratase small subunit
MTPIITGRAWAFGPGVSAALIVPVQHLGTRNPGRYLMTPVDPAFPTRVRPGDILVGGGDFASGTVDDTPVRAMCEAGIAALVATSFDENFARLAFALGLLAVEVNESLAIHTGARLRVDLEGARVVNLSSGDRYPIRNLSDAFLERFRVLDA